MLKIDSCQRTIAIVPQDHRKTNCSNGRVNHWKNSTVPAAPFPDCMPHNQSWCDLSVQTDARRERLPATTSIVPVVQTGTITPIVLYLYYL